ncbi:hypothetical protein DICPUDRAFT_159036 [Dictyostelium purpureum]|uniref:VPS9 domain-containing protein n=1 Tax=Dictyostelium purpureum TaxID=5786 RepID=F1A339_DICPU|nr:uncharacterized protein DICPUDRAFT_159036 [Dictyostelium purpureum]EGC29397.1 hypothetical protein DICPUDRAFT_159036 [Dictyostelium purpureum]|eukprot:XP_003294084.1 hypothetical protein DICPUDRAFT_159036 [Dictyostelium purpureum]
MTTNSISIDSDNNNKNENDIINNGEKLISAETSSSTIAINNNNNNNNNNDNNDNNNDDGKENKNEQKDESTNETNKATTKQTNGEEFDPRVIKSASITLTETISPKRKPYTVYRVEVELSDSSVYVVYRRYSEFLEFDLKLHAAFPLAKIPFPPKKTFGKMNNEFIGQRKEDLQKFTNSIFNSPTLGSQLSAHPLVVDFFTANEFDTQHSQEQALNNANSNCTNSANNINGNKTIVFNNRKNRAVSVSRGADSSIVVTRLIISTLSYWAHFLDLPSLLALTNTCSYLFNTISNFADLWKILYYEHFSILHFNQINITNCQCQFMSNKKDLSIGLINNNSNNNNGNNSNSTTSNNNNNGGTLNRSTSLVSLSLKDENCIENQNINNNNNNNITNSPQKLKSHRLTSSSSSLATLSTLFISSQNLLSIDSNNNDSNKNENKLDNKTNDGNKKPQNNKHKNSLSHSIYRNFKNINHNQIFYINSKPIVEFNRILFLHLLSTHYKLRTNIESHTSNKTCNCYALKLKGTIIGTPETPTSFLSSLNTLLTDSCDKNNNNNNNNNNSNNNNENKKDKSNNNDKNNDTIIINNINQIQNSKKIISHTVSNSNILCIQTVDTSNILNTERLYSLSFSHFVIITFSLIDKQSYEDVSNKWFDEVKSICPEVPIILVGLHRDQRENQIQGQSISYVQGLELSRSLPDCIGYIESPSASDGVGGNRNSLLNELSSLLFHHYRESVFTFDFKKNKYEIYLSFLSKIYPKYSNDYITNVLSSYSGDIEKTMETLADSYSSYIPDSQDHSSNGIGRTKNIHINKGPNTQNNNPVGSPTSSSPSQWVPSSSFGSKSELRQSWNAELSKMDKEYRDRLIEGYISDQPKQRRSIVLPSSSDNVVIGGSSESITPVTPPSSSVNNTNNNTTTAGNTANTSPVQTRPSIKIPDQQINALIEKLKKSSVDDFIKGFLKKKSQNQDILAEMIMSFLREMKTKIQSSQVFSPLSKLEDINEEDFTESPLAEIENHLYQSVYKFVFSSSETLERDSLLTDRTNRLSTFLEPQHLEISPIHCDKDLWSTAQQELQGLNDLFSPSQKLECILKCCKVILYLLSSSDSPGGADDFLPHLIYVIIHANVPHLVSNFEFISKFCNPEQLRMERYYYLTTFGIAITFIENIDAKQLKIDPEEYHAAYSGKKKSCDPSKAKIMQKLGIDEKTASMIEFSPKKHSRRPSGTSVSSSVSSTANKQSATGGIISNTGADDGSNHITTNDENLSSSVGSYSIGSLGSHQDHFDDLLKQASNEQPVPIQSWSTSLSSTPFDDLDDGNKKLLLRFSKVDRSSTSPDSSTNLSNININNGNNSVGSNNSNGISKSDDLETEPNKKNVEEHPLI